MAVIRLSVSKEFISVLHREYELWTAVPQVATGENAHVSILIVWHLATFSNNTITPAHARTLEEVAPTLTLLSTVGVKKIVTVCLYKNIYISETRRQTDL